MFEVEGKKYELKYTLGRIELIERSLKDSIMHIMAARDFSLSISEMKILAGYALQEIGTDTYISAQNGLDMAEKLITNNGYPTVMQCITETLMRDCPFFFQTD